MGDHPRWLKNYYGSYITILRPQIVMDGEHRAVVRLMSGGKISYVLIKKRGMHVATPHEAVFSGIPNAEDLGKMRTLLDSKDKP